MHLCDPQVLSQFLAHLQQPQATFDPQGMAGASHVIRCDCHLLPSGLYLSSGLILVKHLSFYAYGTICLIAMVSNSTSILYVI